MVLKRLVCFFLFLLTPVAFAQSSGAVAPGEPKYRVIRSISGAKGEDQAGRFVILDPRTIFYLPADKKVIAYFEWEGPLGMHHFEGLWKNPDGKISVVSDFKYEAKQKRFAGYWELLLTDSIRTGLWTIEARVDGESAGVHTFQIISSAKPAVAEVTRKLLSLSDLYKIATAATVRVENLSAAGVVQREGLGFVVEDGSLLTAFQVVDGASRLRFTPAAGAPFESNQLGPFDRAEDWAVLHPQLPPGHQRLTRAAADSWSVGDSCGALNVNESGALVLVNAQITGIQKLANVGERISVASTLDRKAVGSPLFNDYGEVVGIMGGVPFPGAFTPAEMTLGLSSLRMSPYPGAAIPISKVKAAGQSAPLSQWAASGALMPAVHPVINISRGAIAKKIENKRSYPDPLEERFVYQRSDGQVTALIVWRPQKKLKGVGTFQLFASNNRLLLQSKPSKLNFDPRDAFVSSTWAIPLGSLANDTYRVDLRLDDATVWRGFFRIAD